VTAFQVVVLLVSTSAVFRFFRKLGIFGLFLLSALDSSFLMLPFGNDLLLIALVSADRGGVSWIGYVLASALGSVLGVFLLDLVSRKMGEKGLERFVSAQKVAEVRTRIEKNGGITVFLATLIPPPFPFTPVVMTASALQYPRKKLLGVVFLARIIRFTIEAVLAIYLGRKLIRYANSDGFLYFIYVLIGVAIIASAWSIVKWLKR
jgi:membrane protein YqaA with SNARE-associated domain